MALSTDTTFTEMELDEGDRLQECDEEVMSARKALQKFQALSDSLQRESLDNLANTGWKRYKNSFYGHAKVLLTQLRYGENPRDLLVDSFDDLGGALLKRFEQGGQQSDIDEAISMYKQALNLRPAPHYERCVSLSIVGRALYRRFKHGGQQVDLDEAISLHRQALDPRIPPHPDRSMPLGDLGLALWTRFEQGNLQSDLDEAISMHRQALELRSAPHPDRWMSLSNLGSALSTRFEQGGHQLDLDEAISTYRQALDPQVISHSDQSRFLNNLAVLLSTRFEQGGQQFDLEEAISMHKQALKLRVASHPDRSDSLANLGVDLGTRFEQGGQQSDLDEAISVHRQALELRTAPHPHRSNSLSSLAAVLSTRFDIGGQQVDLNEAISMHREALELRVAHHPNRSNSLNNLGITLWTRFEQGHQQFDLEEAISMHRQALELRAAPHPDRSLSLDNLGIVLHTRFEEGGQQVDLDEAISMHRQALELRVAPHPDRSISLVNLGGALWTRFDQGRQQIDLDEVISLYRQALELQISTHSQRYKSLFVLGATLIHAHSLYPHNPHHLMEAMETFRSATQCINLPASWQLYIAHTWIKQGILNRHPSVIDAFEAALQALPKLAALRFDVQSRQKGLLDNTDGLARDASRFAIQAGKIDKAIQFLEEGRAVFWSQFLSLRSPFEQLHKIAPQLADKLRSTASALELGSHRNTPVNIAENRHRFVTDQETAQMNRLNEEWLKTIEDIRELRGFEDFLRPRSLSALQMAASDGPVVMLVGNDEGSDILILTSANVYNIRIPDFPEKKLQKLVHLIQAASSTSKIWRSHFEDISSTDLTEFPVVIQETLRNWSRQEEERGVKHSDQASSDSVFKFVLKTLWNEVVRPVIDKLDLKKSEDPPVVRWCPTGLFSFLPIHAAGCYDDETTIDCASDYFISSYTPTIAALLTQECPPSSAGPFKMMAVIQPRDLPLTQIELEKIERHVPSNSLLKFGIPGASASVEAVASNLSEVAIVHFSCHGTQDQSNPLNSGLKLEDGWLRVSRIMKENLSNGALAFLCACETAMGAKKLPDEVMSLGASLLFSGFRRVVATMWVMMDKDGPIITDAFYGELFRGPNGEPAQEPDDKNSARALHLAVKELRSKGVSFRRWVPFIHLGK